MAYERKITVIPATKSPLQRMQKSNVAKRRTAAYARVSTDKEEQFTSYEAQIDYYTKYINKHSEWEFIKVYTDEGISGLNVKKREGFNLMIDDALNGKIDLIITKSISRFARNTVDSLVAIRKLKEKGVEVYFEKENIWTFDGKGELLITIMASLAQEESRSISENVTWGHRKRFADGKVYMPYKQFLGYEKGEGKDAPPVVNPEQAALVRRIYSLYMQGRTYSGIAKLLTNEGIPTPANKTKWSTTVIESILTNEKYRGSARLQKKFTVDFLTKKSKRNEGEVPQYYIEQSHEPIIDPVEWDAVQDEIMDRKKKHRSYRENSIFNSKIVCSECGSFYGPKVWHSNDKYRRVVWRCNNKYEGGDSICKTPHINEEQIKSKFLEVYNSFIVDKQPIIKLCKAAETALLDTKAIDSEMTDLANEIEIITDLMRKCIAENSSTAMNQSEYIEKYNNYSDRYEKAKSRYDELTLEKKEKKSKKKLIDTFLKDLSEQDELITEFDNHLWMTIVDKVVVNTDGTFSFHMFGGQEVTV